MMIKKTELLPMPQRSEFANQAELTEDELAIVGGDTGREDTQGATDGEAAADDIRKPIGATQRSTRTSRSQDGMHDDETDDGLTNSEEMARHNAEDLPTGAPNEDDDDVPVFDRADTPPRI